MLIFLHQLKVKCSGRCYYYFHFTDGETEVRTVKGICSRSPNSSRAGSGVVWLQSHSPIHTHTTYLIFAKVKLAVSKHLWICFSYMVSRMTFYFTPHFHFDYLKIISDRELCYNSHHLNLLIENLLFWEVSCRNDQVTGPNLSLPQLALSQHFLTKVTPCFLSETFWVYYSCRDWGWQLVL